MHRPVLLSLRNAFRRRQRLVLTLISLATAGAVFIGAQNLRRAVLRATELLFAAQQYDLSLRLSAPVHPDSLETAVRSVAGVAVAEAWTGASAAIDRGDEMPGDGINVMAAPVGSTLLIPQVIARRRLARGDDHEIVVGRGLS